MPRADPPKFKFLKREEGNSRYSKGGLAALRERHAGATVRYVDDSVDDLRAVAADARLLSVQTFYAAYGYSTPAQEALVGAMPRVRTLASSRDLEGVLAMPRKDGMIM